MNKPTRLPAQAIAQIELRPVKQLIPYARNPRTHSKVQIAQLADSLRKFRWTNPVLVDEGDEIVAGHGRVLAANEIYRKNETISTVGGETLPPGMVPVIVARGWSEAEKKAYVIADNKLALNAGWDLNLLRLEMGELATLDFDLGITGFNTFEIGTILGNEQPEGEEGFYSKKLTPPIYTPSGAHWKPSDLIDEAKCLALQKEIAKASLPADVAHFLLRAAERHVVFDFHRIADFYASATPAVQRLMEKSALVIVDYDAAIANGWVSLTEKLGDIVGSGGAIVAKDE